MANQRIGTIDTLKFLLIFSVCFAHLINIDLYNPDNVANHVVFSFLHSVNMPLFVFLSGMFFRKKEMTEMLKGIYPMIGAYLIFQVITPGKILTYSGEGISWFINGWQYNITHLYDPADSLWYLISLPFWRIFLNSTPDKIIKKPILTIGIALCLSFLAGFVPIGRIMSFQRTFAFYPYFLLGYYLKPKVGKLKEVNVLCPLLIVFAYIVLVFLFKRLPIDRGMSQCNSYASIGLLKGFKEKMFFYLWPIPMAASFLTLALKIPRIQYFEQEGRQTLFFYLYHMFFVLLFRIAVIRFGAPCNPLIVLGYSAVCFGVMRVMRNWPFLVWLTRPSFNHSVSVEKNKKSK